MMRLHVLLLALLLLTCPILAAQSSDAQQPMVMVVVGAPGAAEYAAQFAEWAGLWEKACQRGGAVYRAVGLDPDETKSEMDVLRQSLADLSAVQATSTLWLVLIGHGTYDGRTAKFNLRGPDVSARDLAQWLEPLQRPVAVINTASSSAPFLTQLGGPRRIVLTATKSGFEQNLTRFGLYLAAAIGDPAADLDKDGQTSLLEAFISASDRVNAFYGAAGRLVTEHALLDDNGDTLGTPADWFRGIRPTKKAAENASLDGYRAHQLHLVPSETEAQMSTDLRAQRNLLELQVMQLRDSRESLSEADYFTQLETLLYEIARIYEQTEKARTKKPVAE
jgi:hypothetical protein